MSNTIILKHGAGNVPCEKFNRFSMGDTIFGTNANPVEICRWGIDEELYALKTFVALSSKYRLFDTHWYIEEYALEYCECDKDGNIIETCGYDVSGTTIVL